MKYTECIIQMLSISAKQTSCGVGTGVGGCLAYHILEGGAMLFPANHTVGFCSSWGILKLDNV